MRAKPKVRPELDSALHDPVLEVVVRWGENVLRVEHVRAPGELVLGDGDGSEAQAAFAFDLARLGVERLVLARHDGEQATLLVPSALGARVAIDGVELEAAQLGPDGCLALPEGALGQLELCGLVVHVRATHAPRDAALRAVQPGRFTQPWTLASLAAHLLVLGLFYIVPPRSHALNLDDVDRQSRLVRFALEARSRPDEPPDWTHEPGKEGEGSEGKPAEGDEGAIGDRHAPTAPRRAATRGPSPTPTLAMTPLDAREAGILGLLRAAAPASTSAFTADAALGSDATDALGMLVADRIGSSFGFGGLGPRGTGRGGGGDGSGTVGVGTLGTYGVGKGEQGRGYGANGGGLGPRSSRVPRLRAEPPDVSGGLAKEVIRRIVHRHLAEVRHCYEQRLLARPDLQGRVVVRFVIGSNGTVGAAIVQSSTLQEPTAELCIAAAVRRWTFPVPDGAGIVSVSYPFVLQQTGP